MRAVVFSSVVILGGLIACADRRAQVRDSTASNTLPAAVLGACAEVASDWRRIPNVTLHEASDTLLVPEIGIEDSSVHACRVFAEDSVALAKSDSARFSRDGPSKSTYWRTFSRAGWVQLRFAADGPDGSLTTYHRGVVRCQLQEEWDGGDDSDSTYVPAPFYRQITSCWSHPAGIAMHDTTP